MSREKTDFWVGLFVLLGAAALVFLALRAGNLSSFSFAPTYSLTADFDNIGGLKVRAPIKSAGVVVGRVTDIRFDDQTFQAVVSMDLEAPYQFPLDSSASILTSGLLGEQYIGLTPGSEEKDFADGGKIRYTQSAVVLEQLISKFLYGTAEKQGTAGDAP
ncbi:outer membrane lipid asymmetry maintenance protein MlaD [Bordetella trematum]|uniref:Virulence protein transporter n=1 Tax=Bordetella trematum TaxID=123899 RepID=A0A157SC96_9BORD|nr:outer membrane lipid asymmetry maintenance protein MlaD [Bordetella trematum]AUL48826.1 outer membrane lipid asymmetry maintenance protein MlaD [Bordetella trematum]AZR95770.1 outer membrane lipid asymmetry maintenance protein MlaD [Bordetella trematum]NNH18802.1 outer membrane lipid asymmetry maintenance protein MlaD [Bordetella trematum]QIM70749.1 outer membrane lipid asymmetry maintenance protein MlaD [Bordetella trematum]CZZ90044.1 virulence protein transporter [Bordetella trematum]